MYIMVVYTNELTMSTQRMQAPAHLSRRGKVDKEMANGGPVRLILDLIRFANGVTRAESEGTLSLLLSSTAVPR